MPGQSTHSKRRYGLGAFHSRYFVGRGLDVGGGHDSLVANAHAFGQVTKIDVWDVQQGDAQFLASIPDDSYDFLHSSHTLEHLTDPFVALGNWIRVVKPSGHVIVTVPDEDLYEKGFWPSKFNPDHKWSFTVYKTNSWNSSKSVNVLDLSVQVAEIAEVEKIEIVRDFYNELRSREIDQTAETLTAECVIEFILRKRIRASVS